MRLMHVPMGVTVLTVLTVMSGASIGYAADRLTDRDVKSLVDRIDEGRDRFEGALDDKLKGSIYRGPAGEVNVKNSLNDFEENVKRLKDRLKPGYAASAEVATVLRQGGAIDRFLSQQPAGTKGGSEWSRLAADLKTLAGAYGADFPVGDNAAVRRVGDGELATSLDALAKGCEQLKGSFDKELKADKSVTPQARQAAVEEANQLSKDAKLLQSRVKDGKPSSAEADKVLAGAAKMDAALTTRQVPQSTAAWTALAPRLSMLRDAYGRR